MEKSDEMYPHLDMRSRRGEGEYCGLSDSRAGAVSYARAGVERTASGLRGGDSAPVHSISHSNFRSRYRGHVRDHRDGMEDTDEEKWKRGKCELERVNGKCEMTSASTGMECRRVPERGR